MKVPCPPKKISARFQHFLQDSFWIEVMPWTLIRKLDRTWPPEVYMEIITVNWGKSCTNWLWRRRWNKNLKDFVFSFQNFKRTSVWNLHRKNKEHFFIFCTKVKDNVMHFRRRSNLIQYWRCIFTAGPPGRSVRLYLVRISVIFDFNWVKTTFSPWQIQSDLSHLSDFSDDLSNFGTFSRDSWKLELDFSDNLTNLSRKKIWDGMCIDEEVELD